MAGNKGEPYMARCAVVTGAGRGIGRSIALALAEAGADVVVTGRTRTELEEVALQIRGMGRQALPIACDVTDQSQVQQLADNVYKSMPRVEILVNNAGASGSSKFITHDDELWHHMLAINLTSVYYVTKAFTPAMVTQRYGRIIMLASIASRIGARYIAAYTASKHGVLGLTRALAAELGPANITVNAICPGYVDTPMTAHTVANMMQLTGMTQEESRATLEKMSPQRRLVSPEEVARIAVFLAQEASGGINGQAINIDGGGIMS
jgi:NAD(P)-dependent dehydrogenase (short-subunit alcohol dehydrogenase family)